MPNLQNSSETETIVGIQFGVFSPDEVVRRSVVEITSHVAMEGKIGGLFDPRMGVLENGKLCRSCGLNNHNCPGHFGHYKLARPVYYIQFYKLVMKILRCVCVKCGKLRIDKNRYRHLLRSKGEARWKQVLELCSKITRCGEDIEDGCGARQPSKYKDEDICRIVAEWKDMPELPDDPEATAGLKDGVIERYLEPEYVYRLLRRIGDEDVDFMGFSRFWCRPDWMMCTVLPIPPPQVRPSVLQDNNQRSEDDLTQKLIDIIKTNHNLTQKIQQNAKKKAIDEWTTVLQYHIATLIDNEIPGVAPSAQRSGRPLKSLQQRLGSKEGRIRNNLQGKRVEFSARSVITPDPNISVAELGVPLKIAMNLTHPERVTAFNIDRLYALIQNGPDKYPGAKTIVRAADGRMISLKHVNAKEIQLYSGDIVNRHIMDGDIVLFNRQPSLHRMSMMGHRAKVLPYNTFRLNVSVTAPYNADFDGDEMNAHIPQSIEAAIELREIAAVPLQIVGPRESKPIVSVVQDTLVGVNRFTRPNMLFNRREAMNLLVWAQRWDGHLPAPAVTEPHPLWSGAQLLSTLLPPVNLEMRNISFDDAKDNFDSPNFVKIHNGIIKQGILDKDVFSKALIHVIYNDYGHEVTVDFLDSLQRMMANFLMNSGFSVGISDLIADEETKGQIETELSVLKGQIEDILLQVHTGLFDNSSGRTNHEEFESKIFATLNKVIDRAGKAGRNSLSDDNRMTNMIKAGSKGSNTNVAQMIAVLGQQNIEGKRIPYGFQDRTLPHFKRFDDGAAARGFIESSFVKGLTPHEFFFHAMSGREGLIDTAVKSVTGDTPIIILEDGKPKRVAIGDWIDAQLYAKKGEVEHFQERNLELLQLAKPVYIPTADQDGKVTWGEITAITRHDPGDQLYEIKTLGGKSVIVTESKSLLIYNDATKQFERMSTPDVRPGHCVPVSMNLVAPPVIVDSVDMSDYLPKDTYLYGTDFDIASKSVSEVMEDRERVPGGWWEENNGKSFTLPYVSKARFARTHARSNTDNIKPGYVYPFTTNREHARIPDHLSLNADNGRFIGLYLAEGNVDVKSGYIQITNNNTDIREFVKDWFENQRVEFSEVVKLNHIGGTSSTVRGFSTVLAKFMDLFVGHGAESKHVPKEAFAAPEEFIVGLLDGYFSGDGTVSNNSVEVGSASAELIDGISMLCTRLGIFGKVFKSQLLTNNLGTETILPTYRLSIRAQWATLFAKKVALIDGDKNIKLQNMTASASHRNFAHQNDVVLDEIVEINVIGVEKYPKVYDLTVPSTLNFGLANGLHVVDTADTGYMQRQLVKAMEDLCIQHDGSVRDAVGNIIQFAYGEDSINCTKIESQPLNLGAMTDAQISEAYAVPGASAKVQAAYIAAALEDRRMLVERVFRSRLEKADKQNVYYPVHLDRLIHTVARQFEFTGKETPVAGEYLIQLQSSIAERTAPRNRLWHALLRYHMAPLKLTKLRYSREAADLLAEQIVLKHWKAMANPGEMVGIIAAQSIGEPSTQMTLNSVDWDTRIMIAKNGRIVSPQIGEFIDNYLESAPEAKIQRLANDQIYIDLDDGNDWQAISCDTQGRMVWTKLEAITRHPVINDDGTDTILEVTLQSGRKVKATKGKSFLSLVEGQIKEVNGSDLQVGTVVPIANSLALSGMTTVESNGMLVAEAIKSGLPDWVLQADDLYVKGLVTGLMEMYGQIATAVTMVLPTSDLLVRTQLLLTRFGIFSSSAGTTLTVAAEFNTLFAKTFRMESIDMQKAVNRLVDSTNANTTMGDIVWDTVKTIKEVKPIHGWVYDVTVENTKNFMTLDAICMRDTFHLAGVAAKSNMTRGVPRLKELLKATKNPKAVSLTIPLRKDLRHSKDEARRVAQELEFTVLQDLVTVARIYFDPRDDATLIADDAQWLAFYAAYERAVAQADDALEPAAKVKVPVDTTEDGTAAPPAAPLVPEMKRNPWILRLELDREKMFSKNITMDDVAYVLDQKFNTEVSTIYSDYNSTRLVFRLRMKEDDDDPLNSLSQLKMLQNKILGGTIVRGAPGLRTVSFTKTNDMYELIGDKYVNVEQFVLDTDGSNFLDVMCHPDVDAARVYSNNVHDIFENLGIEATRAVLFKEISTLFEETYVNYRHLCLLCDVMASRGRLMSVDRYGINKNNIGPLAKASFEQTEDIMLRAALYGELDPITGVSANIMTGQPIRGGTSFSQILLDEEALIRNTAAAPAMKRFQPKQGAAGPTDDELESLLYKEESGYCASQNLTMDTALPPISESQVAEDLPDVEVVLVDE
uniref:DNA-directed RNA polymerase n=1 Tax=viral metagenome TaxID=1070528 RepID=A0A6C0DR67_9ZZZZ